MSDQSAQSAQSARSTPSRPPGGLARLRVRLAFLLVALTGLAALVGVPGPASAETAAAPAADERTSAASTYSAPLRTAVRSLSVATEVRTGYSRDLFPHWIDADGDGCNTREEVLLDEAETRPTVGSGCSLSGGRWFSYFDRVSVNGPSGISIDHMVPLAEAWDSGARSWSSTDRRAFANDLGDHRALVGVTTSVNSSKSDSDPAQWQPQYDKCRYIVDWTATKIRWGLTVDTAERNALISRADSCTNVTVTVTRALTHPGVRRPRGPVRHDHRTCHTSRGHPSSTGDGWPSCPPARTSSPRAASVTS